VKVITHHLVPRLRVQLLPQYAFKAWAGTSFSCVRINSEKRQLASCLSVYRMNQRGTH